MDKTVGSASRLTPEESMRKLWGRDALRGDGVSVRACWWLWDGSGVGVVVCQFQPSLVRARGLRREDFFDELGADEGGELFDDVLSRGWIGGG